MFFSINELIFGNWIKVYPGTSAPTLLPKSTVGPLVAQSLVWVISTKWNLLWFLKNQSSTETVKQGNCTLCFELRPIVFFYFFFSSSCLELLWKCIFSTQCISRNFAMHFIDFVNFVRCCCCAPVLSSSFWIQKPSFQRVFLFQCYLAATSSSLCQFCTVLKDLEKVRFWD